MRPVDNLQAQRPNPMNMLPRKTWKNKKLQGPDIWAVTVSSSSFKNTNDKEAVFGGMKPRNAKEHPKMSGSIIWTSKRVRNKKCRWMHAMKNAWRNGPARKMSTKTWQDIIERKNGSIGKTSNNWSELVCAWASRKISSAECWKL